MNQPLLRRCAPTLFSFLLAGAALTETPVSTAAVPETPTDWPTNTVFLSERTHAHFKANEPAKAYFWANRWLAADGKAVEAHLIRAETLMDLQAPAAAVEACDAGIALSPPDGFRLFRLLTLRASALDAVGQADSAWNDVRRARSVAGRMGEGAAELLRGIDKLQWRLFARMHAEPARLEAERRPKASIEAGSVAHLLIRTAEARHLMAARKFTAARPILREVVKYPAAPPEAAFLLWSAEQQSEAAKDVAPARKRAIALGYHPAMLAGAFDRDASQFAPRPVPLMNFHASGTVGTTPWFQSVLKEYERFTRQHPASKWRRDWRREHDAIRKKMVAFPERVDRLRGGPVTAAVWRSAMAEAGSLFEELGQLRSESDGLEWNLREILEFLTSARNAAESGKSTAHKGWTKQFSTLVAQVEKASNDHLAHYAEHETLSSFMGFSFVEAGLKDEDGINAALGRLWQKRVADELSAGVGAADNPGSVLKETDILAALERATGTDSMTPALLYRRASAARELGHHAEALVAGATARSEAPDDALGAPLRQWMDEALAEAETAPQRAAREKAAGNLEAALTLLQKAVQVDRSNTAAHVALADLYADAGAGALAGQHAEAAWRSHITDPLEIRSLMHTALQAGAWRLAYVASQQLLKSNVSDSEVRYAHALGAMAIGDQAGAREDLDILSAAGELTSEGSLLSAMLLLSGTTGDKPLGTYHDDAIFKNTSTSMDFRFWSAIDYSVAGKPLPPNLVGAATADWKQRLEPLSSYFAGGISAEDYRAQAGKTGDAGFAGFAIAYRGSFVKADENVRRQLLDVANDPTLPALWRAVAMLRARVVFNLTDGGPLSVRDAVLVPLDSKTIEGALELARPGQRIEIHGALNARGYAREGEERHYALPAKLPGSVRISSPGHRVALGVPRTENYVLGEFTIDGKPFPTLHEFDGVRVHTEQSQKVKVRGGVWTVLRSRVPQTMTVAAESGAMEGLDSMFALPSDGVEVGAAGLVVFDSCSVGAGLKVHGEALLHRGAFDDGLYALGPGARVTGRHILHQTGIRAGGGGQLRLTESLGSFIGPIALSSHDPGSLVQVDRIVVPETPSGRISQTNGGKVVITRAIPSPVAMNPSTDPTVAPTWTEVNVSTAAELTAALAKAKAGDEIKLAPGDYVGQFVVPVGLRLTGDLSGDKKTRIIADVRSHTAALRVAGTGVTALKNLIIALQSDWKEQYRNPSGSVVPVTRLHKPMQDEKKFTALDVKAGSMVSLDTCFINAGVEFAARKDEHLQTLRVGTGAVVLGYGTKLQGNVEVAPEGHIWIDSPRVDAPYISGGGTVSLTTQFAEIPGTVVSGAGTRLIAGPAPNVYYIRGAVNPREPLDLNAPGAMLDAVWSHARRSLSSDLAAAGGNEETQFRALMAYQRKVHRTSSVAGLHESETIQHAFREIKPFLANPDVTARALINMEGDNAVMVRIADTLDQATRDGVRKYAQTVVDMYQAKASGSHEKVLAYMAFRNNYPPGTKFHEAAMKAANKGLTLGEFQQQMLDQERARAEENRRLAERARLAQEQAAAARQAALRAQAQSAQQPQRSSYTPTWDGSFSSQAMASWSALNRQVQASQQRYYEREYKAGNRSVPW